MARQPRRTHLGAHFNEGARRLWGLIATKYGSQAALAEAIGESGPLVSRWLYGDRRPERDNAEKLETKLGIPTTLWARAPSRPFTLPGVEFQKAAGE